MTAKPDTLEILAIHVNNDQQRLWADAMWLPFRTKGVLAISCLIRNNPAGLNAFLAAGGVSKLVSLLQEDNPRLQRQAPSVSGIYAHNNHSCYIDPPCLMVPNAMHSLVGLHRTYHGRCIAASFQANQRASVTAASGSDPVWVIRHRKALQLLTHIAHEKPFAVPTPQVLPPLLRLIDSADKELREAALALFVQLARDPQALAELRKVCPFLRLHATMISFPRLHASMNVRVIC